jgi:hypothetical protein
MIDDAEPWEFFHDSHPRARKEHRCDECSRVIQSGERYRYATGKCDGSFCVMRQCLHCVEVGRWLMVACSGYLFNAVQEDLAEHVIGEEDYLRSAPLTRLLRWMRADWKRRDGSLRPLEDVTTVTDAAIAAYKEQMKKVAA